MLRIIPGGSEEAVFPERFLFDSIIMKVLTDDDGGGDDDRNYFNGMTMMNNMRWCCALWNSNIMTSMVKTMFRIIVMIVSEKKS